jgi:hypothetical protein
MSILGKLRRPTNTRKRTSLELARALRTAPTRASREELLLLRTASPPPGGASGAAARRTCTAAPEPDRRPDDVAPARLPHVRGGGRPGWAGTGTSP